MGEHESWAQPSGLMPNASPLIQVLESERWVKAEERTAELIACIQPNPPSEGRRNAVADYVQRLIMKCFSCQVVFTFGSVPLKTYLPDGDIDLTAFSNNENMKETWANQVRHMLESEEKNENAEFRVKEVQYIQAEVKIIKCLVENIVVDISFNQLGGLCTLCFLEEVDHLINQNHLFKRSIILIKAWCYYESRILGAHHGLISTYALETLVLYIFHVFNNSFTGPLEVLYRFLEFFSNFDWDNFCVSLWGPVAISSLPDRNLPERTVQSYYLANCFLMLVAQYMLFSLVAKKIRDKVLFPNISIIRSAFAFGAKRLARLLDCPKENLVHEINQFFMNTWDRHGSGNRPDAPTTDIGQLRLSIPDHLQRPENLKNNQSAKKLNENASGQTTDVSSATCSQSQKNYGNLNSSRISDPVVQEVSPNLGMNIGKGQSVNLDHLVNDIQGRFLFARTRSSPELTETHSDVSSRGQHNKAPESGKAQATAATQDTDRRKKPGSEILANHSARSSTSNLSSVRHVPSHQSLDATVNPSSGLNSYHRHSGSAATVLMDRFMYHLNLSLANLPFPISPSILASMGYSQRNFPGMVRPNFPLNLIDPSFSNMHFPQGLFSPGLTHYCPGIGLASKSEDIIEQNNENFGSMEVNPGEADHDFWQEQDVEPDSRNYEMLQSDDKPQSSSVSNNFVPSSSVSGSSMRVKQKSTKENRESMQEYHQDSFSFQDNRGNDFYSDDRTMSSRFSSAAHSNSLRSKTSSESSWDGSSPKVSKSTREKRGKKTFLVEPSSVYWEKYNHAEEDDRDWNPLSTIGSEMAERSSVPQSVGSLQGLRQHIPGYELPQTSESDSMLPIAPVLLGPGSQQRMTDNSGPLQFTFYPTGPPVPFLTMLPFYDIPPETRTSDALTSHFSGQGGLDSSDSGQNFDSSMGLDQSEELSTTNSSSRTGFVETSDEHKADILNSDFASHWQNLQYGRFCQNPQYHGPVVYPSPVVPPMYMQGHFPWDGPGRPLSANMNLFTQLMGYGPQLIPVAPLQSVSNRPPNIYQQYVDELPRHRTGTGTYLPNPKLSIRDRHSLGARRGNYSYDRSDNHSDREGNWNANSKSRSSGRNHSRNQTEKSNSRLDRLASSENRAGRLGGSYRRDSVPSYQSQNGVQHSNSSQSGPPNVAYGMYPLPAMNSSSVSANGPTVPPAYHNASNSSHAEQLEFGSLGPVGFSSMNEQPQQLKEGSQARGAFEEQRFDGGSVQRYSPDQPSSPHLQRDKKEKRKNKGVLDYFARSVAQRNYQLKDEDFAALAFLSQVENDNGRN
ncbi:hypothetical protein HYC85_011142 [Camellia sinensis]|uniref:Polymerase nucleotidyl transferase domain-containing protein n=1 Tax=Camellia sinensis TaxID=4442 RepID=A0A7J7HMJ2_CAMSI|nr:hypothetical protein HYC85_011142 [Camellia sinensis]